MRWRFFDPSSDEEAEARNAIIARIDAWWNEFRDKTDKLAALFAGKSRWDLPGWMEEYLQSIHPKLMWEFGPAVRGDGQRLVITPESRHHLRPLVSVILQRAPKIKGWEFYEYRLPESLEQVQATVEGRTGSDCSDFTVHVSCSELHRIDLGYSSPAFTAKTEQRRHSIITSTFPLSRPTHQFQRSLGAIE